MRVVRWYVIICDDTEFLSAHPDPFSLPFEKMNRATLTISPRYVSAGWVGRQIKEIAMSPARRIVQDLLYPKED